MEDDYESEGSYDEEEEEDIYATLKPVFVPKHLRGTTTAKAVEEEHERLWEEKRQNLANAKKEQTKAIVAEAVRINENQKEEEEVDSDAGLPDDTDDVMEFDAWKIREIMRIKRDTEEREAMIREQEEVRRRREMTDEQRAEEDRKLGISREHTKEEKPKWKFLQKYYHKGAFFMDNSSIRNTEDVRLKDYSAPTLEDRVDKEKLPQVLQVKNFGKRGRTKYTHLLDQDTTVQSNKRVDVRPDRKVMDSYLNRMSGMKRI